ncbi:MAG: ORF6N domain-containing protein [Elusimicrobiota bacterium]
MSFPLMPVDPDSPIHYVRGVRVMLDRDLARIYGVSTKRLNEAVRRNRDRFPEDFMFQLTEKEVKVLDLRETRGGPGGRRYLPHAFTEHGAVMLAGVLSTPFAVQASIAIARAFIRLREVLSGNKELAGKLAELERRIEGHDGEIQGRFSAIRSLMNPPDDSPKKVIGFHPSHGDPAEG